MPLPLRYTDEAAAAPALLCRELEVDAVDRLVQDGSAPSLPPIRFELVARQSP